MKLLSGPLSMFGMKAEIAVAEKGVDCEVELVPFSLRDRYKPLHPDVARLNPKGQVPVLMDDEVEIFDSTQIFEYLEHKFPVPALWPSGPAARARARLEELRSDEIFFMNFVALLNAAGDRTKPEAVESLREIEAQYRERNEVLSRHAYMAGDDFTYADIAWFCASFFTSFLGDEPDAGCHHVIAWRKRVAERPAIAPILRRFSDYLVENRLPVPAI
ncbi:MAG: glutathione S-transferase family protein [Parvibaculaceae bacterium]|jgi:glutathione S-transferase